MLSVIVKGTNGCNLGCSYCSVGKKVNVQSADAQMLLEIFRYTCGLCRYRKENHLALILHGGEPTFIQASDYRYALDIIKREYPDIQMKFLMQSNGFHFDDEMISFIKEYDVGLGISLDGCEAIHDAQRKSASGEPTFVAVTENIRKLFSNGIPVSCLMVLTSNALDKGYGYLKYFEQNGISLKINPLLNYGEAYAHPELSLKPGQYANYLIEMYRYILKEDLDVDVSPLDKILRGVLDGDVVHTCTFDENCHKQFLCIDYKGDIYPCGKYSDMREYKIGNIKDGEFDVLSSQTMQKMIKRRTTCMPKKCKECKYQHICHAGCSAEACIDGTLEDAPRLCEDYRQLLSFFHGEGLLLLKQELMRQKKLRQERLNLAGGCLANKTTGENGCGI